VVTKHFANNKIKIYKTWKNTWKTLFRPRQYQKRRKTWKRKRRERNGKGLWGTGISIPQTLRPNATL